MLAPTCSRLRSLCSILGLLAFSWPWALQAQGSGAKSSKEALSLVPTDTLRFETDEGTWMSLDVTPDGQHVVFDLVGDLYRVPLQGGDAERLTEGMAFDAQPRVSPDGRWIAFISDRDGNDNLWIAHADGSEPRKLSSEKQNAMISPAWTPDSKYVIATRRGRSAELRMHHIDGGSGFTIGASGEPAPTGGPGAGASSPAELGAAVSPDGTALYFARATGRPSGQFPMWQIARRDLRTGDVDPVTQEEGSGIRPVLSPDGALLVYGTRYETQTGLRVRDLNTGADRWLVYPVQRDEQETGGAPSRGLLPSSAFTPDGSALLFTEGGKIKRVEVATGTVTEIPFRAQVELAVGPDLTAPYRVAEGPVRARLVQDPQVSPDGTQLVFSVLTKLYVMDTQGGEPRRLTTDDAWAFKPTWSPDGEWIAYVTWSMDGGHVWKRRADGSGAVVQLTTDPAFYTDLTFNPAGDRIVGLRGNAYQRRQTFSEFGGLRVPLDLIWLDAGGGPVHLIAPARGLGAPHFGPEPDRIYVYARAGLQSVRYDGTDKRTHLKVTGPANARAPQPPPAETVIMSPQGGWALAKVNNQLWTIAVPPLTSTPPTVSVRGPSVPTKRVTDIGADYFGWSGGGATITWALGSTVYRRPLESLTFGPDPEAIADSAADAAPDSAAAPADSVTEALDDDESVQRTTVALDFPRATAEGSVALTGGTVITMNGIEVLANTDVVVTDGRIVALGPSGTVSIPDDAHRVDVSGRYLVPGFIDTHAHWEFRTHDVLEPQNWSLIANLAYGVTAGLDVQTATNDYFAYQDLVETGQSLGQRAFMTGPGVFSNNDFQSYEATLHYLKRYLEHYRTPNIKSYMVGNRQQRQWVARAAKELGLMPTTEGGRDLKLDLTPAIDGMHGNEHTLPVTPLFRDVVEVFARTRTAYTPTLLVQYGGPIAEEYFYTHTDVHDDTKLNRFYPHNRLDEMARRRSIWLRADEFTFEEAAADAAKIQRAGGLIGVGGHGQLQGLGYHWEMWALGMGGMTPHEVLQAATIDGARIIGFADDLGSIEVGKLADLVVLDRDPLQDIRNTTALTQVMKNGELFDAATMDRIWPTPEPLPAFWWWDSKPTDHRSR